MGRGRSQRILDLEFQEVHCVGSHCIDPEQTSGWGSVGRNLVAAAAAVVVGKFEVARDRTVEVDLELRGAAKESHCDLYRFL